jgi:hypothetical protein
MHSVAFVHADHLQVARELRVDRRLDVPVDRRGERDFALFRRGVYRRDEHPRTGGKTSLPIAPLGDDATSVDDHQTDADENDEDDGGEPGDESAPDGRTFRAPVRRPRGQWLTHGP